ncbi:unnamed protein product [Agarophyton chilense]
MVLGSDVQIMDFCYVDTTSVSVLESETAMDMARAKHDTDVLRRDSERRKQLARARTVDESLQLQLKAGSSVHADRDRGRSILSIMSVEQFKARKRPMELKRTIERRRASVRKQLYD